MHEFLCMSPNIVW